MGDLVGQTIHGLPRKLGVGNQLAGHINDVSLSAGDDTIHCTRVCQSTYRSDGDPDMLPDRCGQWDIDPPRLEAGRRYPLGGPWVMDSAARYTDHIHLAFNGLADGDTVFVGQAARNRLFSRDAYIQREAAAHTIPDPF